MWPLRVVLGQPRVQIGLPFVHRMVQLFAERDVVEFVLDRPMEALADAIGLRAVCLGLRGLPEL